MTKDFSYSYCTLMPKNKREAEIYFKFMLKEVSELYVYFLALGCLTPIGDALEFNDKRNLFSFLSLLATVALLVIRFVSHGFRNRYPRVYSAHLIILYVISQIRYAFVAYYKLTQVDEALKK